MYCFDCFFLLWSVLDIGNFRTISDILPSNWNYSELKFDLKQIGFISHIYQLEKYNNNEYKIFEFENILDFYYLCNLTEVQLQLEKFQIERKELVTKHSPEETIKTDTESMEDDS